MHPYCRDIYIRIATHVSAHELDLQRRILLTSVKWCFDLAYKVFEIARQKIIFFKS